MKNHVLCLRRSTEVEISVITPRKRRRAIIANAYTCKTALFCCRVLDPCLLLTHTNSLCLCPYAVDAPCMPRPIVDAISLYPRDIVLCSKSCQRWRAAIEIQLLAKLQKQKASKANRQLKAFIMVPIIQKTHFGAILSSTCILGYLLAHQQPLYPS